MTQLRMAFVALISVAIAIAAQARDLTDAEEAALETRAASFSAAVRAHDFAAQAAATLPGVLLRYGQGRSGGEVDIGTARELYAGDLQTITRQIERQVGKLPNDFTMAIADAEILEASDGTPYVLIPAEWSSRSGSGQQLEIRSSILALIDQGEWYFLDVGQPGLNRVVAAAYPSLEGVAFPRIETKVVSE